VNFVYRAVQLTLFLLKQGEIMKILIVGAGIVAYGSAFAALNEGNEVHVLDHAIEFGLPNVWPSVLLDRNFIPLSFSTDQQFEGIDSSFRHEWIMKAMSIELAEKGVRFLHRTRVISANQTDSNQYSVELIGAGQANGFFVYDKIIDTTADTWIPWAKSHQITNPSAKYEIERQLATGFVHLKSENREFSNSIYQINRQDGLSESWFVGDEKTENRKVIEIISTMLPMNQSLWDCSQRFQAGMDLWNTVR
jgi:hypothetical protein